jgi:hypothetical protein
MTALVILILVLLLGPLALFAGADTREQDPRCRHSWWPAQRGER